MSALSCQQEFVRRLPFLLTKAFELGFEVTLGDAYRDTRVYGLYGQKSPYGSAKSKHKLRLAIDLNLFKCGKYLTDYDSYKELGEYWKFLGGIWGGDFSTSDANHYEWPLR